jgi:signal transduction histidine kinase
VKSERSGQRSLNQEMREKVSQRDRQRDTRKSKIEDLINLIHTWLRVLMVDVDKIKETFAQTDVSVVVRKAVENVAPHAARLDIALQVHVAEGIVPVLGDEGTLVEALANVIGNAVKYSRPGGQVAVDVGTSTEGVAIAVIDHGIGISQEDIQHVFDDFFRARSGQDAASGSGLGLAITRRIVEAHGGRITVESRPGAGSTFTIHLPSYSGEPRR